MSKEESIGLLQLRTSFSSSVPSFVEVFTRYVARRDMSCVFSIPWVSQFFVSLHVPPSQNLILSDDSSLAVSAVSGVVSHKSLNNSNVASSFSLFFLNLIDLLFVSP